MAVLVDSNVLIDVSTSDTVWREWSTNALARVMDETIVVINALIYAEVSIHFDSIEELEAVLPGSLYQREPLPYEAAFLAGKAFVDYRRRGGTRGSPLPDFYIGAHAAVSGYQLLTRDAARYRSYFPTVQLITPD